MAIKVLNSSLETVAILNNIIEDKLINEINGEYTFEFTAVINTKTNTYINENYIVEVDNDYFDIVYYESSDNEDGSLTINAQCEHVSYRLNDKIKTNWSYSATPSSLLGLMLIATDFSVDTVEFSDSETYSITEEKTVRLMIFELAALVGGEVIFDKFNVSIVEFTGTQEGKIFTNGKNIKILKKIYDGRAEDGPVTSYSCESINIPNDSLSLGDNILLYHSDLNISEEVRIVKLEYSVLDNLDFTIHLSNKISSLADSLYRITTTKLTSEKRYFGVKIGPDTGFEVEASDQTSRAVFNSDEFVMQKGDGAGNYTDKVYFDPISGEFIFNGTIYAEDGEFSGDISASTISGGTISGTTISGGSITIGSNFSVDSFGYMECDNADFSGDISASSISGSSISGGSISIGSNFSVNTSGYMTCSGASFSGSISATSISGGTISGTSIDGGTITAGDFTTYDSGDSYYINIDDSGFRTYQSGSKHGLCLETSTWGDSHWYYSGSKYFSVEYGPPGVIFRQGSYNFLSSYAGTTNPERDWDFTYADSCDGLETSNLTYSGTDNHNHGITPGTHLAVDGGGYVSWAASGSHYHGIDVV
jgi:hypothetical protein